jgi:S-(hydroxymethyl)glutathione dehydrogenase / alcohol dehydrogenase
MSTSTSLPRRSRSAILVGQRRHLEIAEVELPETLDVGQVLVRVVYSGICGSQLGEIDGVKGHDHWLPHLLGHEGAGHVLAIGPGVKFVKPDDRVVLHWRPARGIEATPPTYRWNGAVVNAGWVTTFNQFAVVSENRLTAVPPDTDLMTAALYGCAVTTGFGVIENRARVRLGDTVVVFGAGGIGLNIVQAAALAGAAEVVAVDRYDQRLGLAADCGATHTINANREDAWTRLGSMFAAAGPDVFVDNTGDPSIIARGFEITAPRGRVVLVGVPPSGRATTLHTLPLHFGKTIIGTHGGEAVPHEDIPRYMRLLAKRRIDLRPLISEVGGIESINAMIERMRSGASAGRCLIEF